MNLASSEFFIQIGNDIHLHISKSIFQNGTAKDEVELVNGAYSGRGMEGMESTPKSFEFLLARHPDLSIKKIKNQSIGLCFASESDSNPKRGIYGEWKLAVPADNP